MKLSIANTVVVLGNNDVVARETAEALFGLHVDAFLAGVSECVPEAADFGLSEDEAAEIRDDLVREHVAA
jgi:hypothetical protein